ncbi:MAG: DOMON-like domain-containing protein [Sphingobium sp.]
MDNIASLLCHPDTPAEAVRGVKVSGSRGHSGFVTARYEIDADMAQLVVPESAEPGRADGLWRTTCMELFTRDPGDAVYREYNFSPSGQWAAYSFTGYRDGMDEIDVWAPKIETSLGSDGLVVDVTFVSPRLGPQSVGASVVIEEKGGAISYWALRHGPGKPDFHHPACFAFELPAPEPL